MGVPTTNHPTADPGAVRGEGFGLRAVAPFGLITLVAIASLFLLGNGRHVVDGPLWTGIAVIAASGLACIALPWRHLPRAAMLLPAAAYIVGIAFLRHAEGGATATVSGLATLPVVWFSLYGDRLRAMACVAMATAMYLVPMLALGAPHYPTTELRKAALVAMIWSTIALATTRLVAELQRRTRVQELVVRLAQDAVGSEARAEICAAACAVTDASLAMLFERTDFATLEATAAAGLDLDGLRVPLDGGPSGVVRAFATGEAMYVADAVGDPRLSPQLVEQTGTRATWFQPVHHQGEVVAVLVIGWSHRMRRVGSGIAQAIEIFAANLALTIERADVHQRMEALARTDALTGLANRRVFDEELELALARARRSGRSCSIALLDLDDFKAYNDEYGHPRGDWLLRASADAWSGVVRQTDLLARYGGEEFALVLADTEVHDAVTLLGRLRDAMPDGRSFSSGVASTDGDETAQAVLERVDMALYAAKRAGKARTEVSGPARAC